MGSVPGTLQVSRDGGTTWAAGTGAPVGQRWIGADISADGKYIAAVTFGTGGNGEGGVYLSSDSGVTFSRIDVTMNPNETLAYESVTISNDGQRIVTAVQNGNIYFSANGGTTFTQSAGAPVDFWRAVDSSADGMTVVAANHNGGVYISRDGGATFAALPVTVGGNAINDGWYRLALSRDGNTLALAGNRQWGVVSTGIYVGNFASNAWTWNQGSSVSGNYGEVTMSANGDVILASLYAPDAANPSAAAGQVLMSSNHGVSFTPITTPSAPLPNWRAIAIDAAATKLILGNGDFGANNFAGAAGKVWISTGSITGQ